MRRAINILLALVVAAIAPAVLSGIATQSMDLVVLGFMAAALCSLAFGAPALAVLWMTRKINVVSATAVGFLIGSVGFAALAWPGGGNTTVWIGDTRTVADGILTTAGWWRYLQGAAAFGLLGIAGALSAWLWLRMTGTLPARETSAVRVAAAPTAVQALASVLVVGIAAGILAYPGITEDRTCHNYFRGGYVAARSLELDVDHTEWPAVRSSIAEFASENDLSLRDDSYELAGKPYSLYISACDDDITIAVVEPERVPTRVGDSFETQTVRFMFYITRHGEEWQRLATAMREKLGKRWPGQVAERSFNTASLPSS